MASGWSLALAHERTYDDVLDRESGRWISLSEFLAGADYGDVVSARRMALEMDVVEGRHRYVCPVCCSPMLLRSLPMRERCEQRFYFKHRNAGPECRGTAGLSADEINAIKFGGAKEGADHKRFKRLVVESLEADAEFSATATEGRWEGIDHESWRRPDVQARWRGRRVAFEVQLATTFVHVLAERMAFYRQNDGLLLWLFRDLDPKEFRLAEDDVFYANNRNAFRVSESTAALSRSRGRFTLECAWYEPTLDDGSIVDVLRSGLVEFGQLSFDVGASGVPRAYYFDYEAAARRLREERAAVLKAEMEARDNRLRDVMEQMVVSHGRHNTRAWQVVRMEFEDRGFTLPERLGDDPHLWSLLQAGYSAKLGRPVGCNLTYLIQLANHFYDRQKPVLWAMSVLLRHYSRGQVFKGNGDMKEWTKRRQAYQHGWATGDPAFAPYRRFDDLLGFLFQAAASRLRASEVSADAAQQK